MKSRTTGILATIASAILCGCPGLFLCVFGALIAAGAPVTTTLGEQTSTQTYPPVYGFALLCTALLLIAIPIVVGFVTLRKKPAAAENSQPAVPTPPAA